MSRCTSPQACTAANPAATCSTTSTPRPAEMVPGVSAPKVQRQVAPRDVLDDQEHELAHPLHTQAAGDVRVAHTH